MMMSGPSPPCNAVRTSRSNSSGGWNVTSSSPPHFLGQLESHYLATGLILSVLQGYSRASSHSPDQPVFLNWITSFMSLHLSEPLSVSDMAARAGLSASRFSQVFRNRFGSRPTSSSCTCAYSARKTCCTTRD